MDHDIKCIYIWNLGKLKKLGGMQWVHRGYRNGYFIPDEMILKLPGTVAFIERYATWIRKLK